MLRLPLSSSIVHYRSLSSTIDSYKIHQKSMFVFLRPVLPARHWKAYRNSCHWAIAVKHWRCSWSCRARSALQGNNHMRIVNGSDMITFPTAIELKSHLMSLLSLLFETQIFSHLLLDVACTLRWRRKRTWSSLKHRCAVRCALRSARRSRKSRCSSQQLQGSRATVPILCTRVKCIYIYILWFNNFTSHFTTNWMPQQVSVKFSNQV